jgi:hypothetical protein
MRSKSLLAAILSALLLLPSATFAFSSSCKIPVDPRTLHQHQHEHEHHQHQRHQWYSKSTTTCLFEQQPEKRSGGSVRFSGIETTRKSDDLTNYLDAGLSFLSSDIVSIVLGGVGLAIIVAHRLSLMMEEQPSELLVVDTTSMAQQTRTDLLAVFACGSVLLDGITKLDVTSALSESVVLDGVVLDQPIVNDDDDQHHAAAAADNNASSTTTTKNNNPTSNSIYHWALQSLLQATPGMSAVVMEKKNYNSNNNNDEWTVTAMAGTVPRTNVPVPEATPILDRVASQTIKETYLPTLQALPGRFEFTYLPSNTQLVLLIPIRVGQVLVLGSNTAKSFSPRDVAWCRVVAERINTSTTTSSTTTS